MGPKGRHAGVGFSLTLLISLLVLFSISAQAAFLYKSYIIRQSGGQDILCDPYIVQKDDYVLKIFRQRGEISQADFPEFLKIFKDVNPQIQDVDTILPGQHIFIPLKKLQPGSVPDQEFGVVTIPFVTQMEIEEILQDHSDVYEVKSGDTVSQLLSTHFGRYGTEAYNEGLSIFKTMNPQVKDVNLILVGEQLWLPRKTLQNELWYDSLFDAAGNLVQSAPAAPEVTEAETSEGGESTGIQEGKTPSGLADAADILEARIYQKGTYYFPRSGRSDFKLDLTKYPVFETSDGARVLISFSETGRKKLSDADLVVLKKFWKDLVVAAIPEDASLPRVLNAVISSLPGGSISEKKVFTDGGIEVTIQPRWMLELPNQDRRIAVSPIDSPKEKTPQPIVNYLETLGVTLKEVIVSSPDNTIAPDSGRAISFRQVPVLDASLDRRSFVRNLFRIAGIAYQENVTVTFEYAGIQIQAVTNALNRPDGLLVLVDFQDLQGEAITTIEKAGFKLYEVPSQGKNSDLIPDLFGTAGVTCESNPTFTTAPRTGADNITLALPGYLVRKDENSRLLLTTAAVPDDLIRYFFDKEVDVVLLENAAGG